MNRSLPMLVALALFLPIGFFSLGCAEMSWNSGKSPGGTSSSAPNDDLVQKPTPQPPEFPSVAWIWSYVESRGSVEQVPAEIPECSSEFRLDQPCPNLSQKCRVSMHIYQCEPEGQLHTYRGRVVDQDGQGIEGALVYAGYQGAGMTNMVETQTVEGGYFQFLYPGGLRLLFVQKDGYRAEWGHYVSSSSIASTHGLWGVYDLEARLVKMNRSVHPEREVNLPDRGCEIVGRVVDDTGKPIAEASVQHGRSRTQTDSTGHYYFSSEQPCGDVCIAVAQGYISTARAKNGRNQSRDMVSCISGQPDDHVFTATPQRGR